MDSRTTNDLYSKLKGSYSKHGFWTNLGVSFMFILLLFHVKFGLSILDPTNFGWLMRWDLHGYVVMLDFYRHEPWGFPIGDVHKYFYPVGANVGELLPILVKILSRLLPEQFQYIGLFLLASYILVAYYSIKLFQVMNVTGVLQLLATLLVLINPVLLYRFIHPSLTAHWLILASLWLYCLSTSKADPTRIMIYQGVLFVLSGLIFPYLAIMVMGFLLALTFKLWRSDKSISLQKSSLYLFACFASLFFCWFVVGIISFSNTVEMAVPNSYGMYGWNLSSFYNAFDLDINGYYKATNLSSILPAFPTVTWAQFEGFSYLGAGMILLVVIAMPSYFFFFKKHRPILSGDGKTTNFYPICIFTILITLYAISNTVTYNSTVLFTIPLPPLLQTLGDIFRASGRFIWIAYYFILIGTLSFLATTLKSRNVATALFVGAFCLQVYDIKKMIWTDKFPTGEYSTPLHDAYWESLIQRFDKVMLYPSFGTTYLTHDDYRYFTWFAAKYRKPVSTGYLGRIDFTATRAFNKEMRDSIKENSFNDRWLYITTPPYLPELLSAYHDGKIQVITLDGYFVFYSSRRAEDVKQLRTEIATIADQSEVGRLFKFDDPYPVQLEKLQDNRVLLGIYQVTKSRKLVHIKGWTFIDGTENPENDSVQLLLQSPSRKIWTVPTKRFSTPDVAGFFGNSKLSGAGFSGVLSITNLPTGSYRIGALVQNNNTGEKIYHWSDSSFALGPGADSENLFRTPTLRTLALPEPSKELKSDLDGFFDSEKELRLEGWIFLDNEHSNSLTRKFILSSPSLAYSFKTDVVPRIDVASHFKDMALLNSGAKTNVEKAALKKGVYDIGLLLSDTLKKKEYYSPTGKKAVMGYPLIATPRALEELPTGTESIKLSIDTKESLGAFLHIIGWAFIQNVGTDFSETNLVLKSENNTYLLESTPVLRPDVEDYFKLPYKIDLAGFSIRIRRNEIPSGEYEICVIMTNKKTGIKTLSCQGDFVKL